MRKKNIAIFLLSVISLFRLNVPAIACCEGSPPGDPSCYECRDGVWKLKAGAECGQTLDCTFGGEGCEICVDCMCQDDDSLCEADECCIDGMCTDPVCDNCHNLYDALPECGHYVGDPNGTPCKTDWCIVNEVSSATCDHKGWDWPCAKSNCETDLLLEQPELTQYKISQACPPQKVQWEFWFKTYHGCGIWSCAGDLPYEKACVTQVCAGVPIRIYHRGIKKKCGC